MRYRISQCVLIVVLFHILGAFAVASAAAPRSVTILWEQRFEGLPTVVDKAIHEFTQKNTGWRVQSQQAISFDEAWVRQVALDEYADLIIIGAEDARRYRDLGFLTPMELYFQRDKAELDQIAGELTQVWGRYEGVGYCLYVAAPSTAFSRTLARPSPAYLCIPKNARYPNEAWELSKLFVKHAGTNDTINSFTENFIQKFFFEKDPITIYRYLIHADRKQEVTGIKDDWLEQDFIMYFNTLMREVQPIIKVSSAPSSPSKVVGGKYYCNDPLQRQSYNSNHINQAKYRIETGITASGPQSNIIARTKEIYVSVEQLNKDVPTWRVFHSAQKGFEQFWFDGIIKPSYCR